MSYDASSNSRYRILITRRTFPEAAARMREMADVRILDDEKPPTNEELREAVRDMDGLYSHIVDEVSAGIMDAAPNLKVITEFGVGYDNIDAAAASERGGQPKRCFEVTPAGVDALQQAHEA